MECGGERHQCRVPLGSPFAFAFALGQQAADWLDKHPQHGKMFNYFTWGGYLLYREWPEQKVFIDGQTDFYGEALTRQYERVITLAPGWEDVLNQYHVRWVLIPPGGPLASALRGSPNRGIEASVCASTAAR